MNVRAIEALLREVRGVRRVLTLRWLHNECERWHKGVLPILEGDKKREAYMATLDRLNKLNDTLRERVLSDLTSELIHDLSVDESSS